MLIAAVIALVLLVLPLAVMLPGPRLASPTRACREAQVAALRVQAAPPVPVPTGTDDDGDAAWAALVTAALAWTPVPVRPGRSEAARRVQAGVALDAECPPLRPRRVRPPSDDALARCARAGIVRAWADVSWYGTDGDAARAALRRAWPAISTARVEAAVRSALVARA